MTPHGAVIRLWQAIRVSGLLLALSLLSPAAHADVEATAHLADGSRRVGVVRSITASEIVLGAEPGVRLATSDVIRLDFPTRALPAPRASLIQLANGDRVAAGLSSMSDESVVALWKSYPDLPPVQIPSSAIAGILMSVPDNAVEKTLAFSQVFGRRDKSDTVLLMNGDRLSGDLTSFDQTSLKLSRAGKMLQIELARVQGMAFNSELSSLPHPRPPRIAVTLSDGSQLTGWNAHCEAGGPLRFSSVFASTLEMPLSAVSAIRFLDGRATYLSDLSVKESRLVPYFGSGGAASPANNVNAAGGPLLVRGIQYPKGLGTRSRSEISYDLAGRFTRFQGTAAIDDYAQGKGSVRFVVDLDGSRVWKSRLVTGSSSPVTVGPLDVRGGQRLTLIVEYGQLADVNDWADWCDAIVIR